MDEEQKTLGLSNVNHLEKLYNGWFLDYASYTILDRAVPYFEDGLKPVQRRILHTMYEMNDGSFHKVAGIVGDTMHYHPHGDASIYTALVNMGQKNLRIYFICRCMYNFHNRNFSLNEWNPQKTCFLLRSSLSIKVHKRFINTIKINLIISIKNEYLIFNYINF